MGKYADSYYGLHPTLVIETGFDPSYAEVSESVFSLGDQHMGLRGYFEEGFSGRGLQGSYVNGVYETRPTAGSAYKGMLNSADFMVNAVDWVYTRVVCNGVTLDLNVCRHTGFERVLDTENGVLTRRFVWNVDADTAVKFTFTRFLCMPRPEIGVQKIEWEVVKGSADIAIRVGLDFSRLHQMSNRNYWNCDDRAVGTDFCAIKGTTETSGQSVYAYCAFDRETTAGAVEKDGKRVELTYNFTGDGSLTRVAYISKNPHGDARIFLKSLKYEDVLAETSAWWREQWALSNVTIDGAVEDAQAIRFCVFQMHQTLHDGDLGAVFGAKGLTGEAYNGNTFWDSEVYCLLFYLFNNPQAAKAILKFRYDTLPEARERAKALDCEGAFYPIATISGKECCDLWQHASLQLQCSTAVAYGIANYTRLTGDAAFLREYGMEIIIEVCRMLSSRGGYDQTTGEWGYWGVMGPDEFQVMVNNNTYTNLLGKKTFEFAVSQLEAIKREHADVYEGYESRLGLTAAEVEGWREKAAKTRIIYDGATKLFEQHDGFFRLPHVDISAIPVEDFPLYAHWSYDRIYRNDMIKQPDVLMFMQMYNGDFTKEQLAANFDYYEPRCIHESSLSPSIHSILAAQLGRGEQAYNFFKFAARMDLDNYNRNTHEGLHTTSIAACWMNVVFGFGGLQCDGETPSIAPSLPEAWQGLTFRLVYKGRVLLAEITREKTALTIEKGEPLEMLVYGEKAVISHATQIFRKVKE